MNENEKKQLFRAFQSYYRGFFIHEPVGNNAFSYHKRQQQCVYVAPLIEGGLNDAALGEEIVFGEMTPEGEVNVQGLKNFIYWENDGKQIFIFDNHNHAFSFWAFALMAGRLNGSEALVHVDQHKDMREPEIFLSPNLGRETVMTVCDYANRTLNVGNFISPALKSGLFQGGLVMVDNEAAFDIFPESQTVADIDLDIFSPQMEYISKSRKISYIRNLIDRSSLITIATSPFFMDQEKALGILKEIF